MPDVRDQDSDDGGPVVGRTGARFGGAPRRRREARQAPPVADGEPVTDAIPVPEPDLPADPATLSVRPYVLTGGRTRAPVDLALETLVGTRPGSVADDPAHRAVLDVCGVVCSVAEVAATVGVPLGVARVLIGDLVAVGALQVHGTATTGAPDQALLARVLDGLRRL